MELDDFRMAVAQDQRGPPAKTPGKAMGTGPRVVLLGLRALETSKTGGFLVTG